MSTHAELSQWDRSRMYIASCMSLSTGAMVFIIRGNIQDQLRDNLGVSNEVIGGVMGLWALGIAGTIFISSWLADIVGLGNLLRTACVLHLISIPLTILAPTIDVLRIAVLMTGLAHGFIEGTINPLIATIYPDQKIHKLNVLHAWWPGGLVIGGLLAVGMTNLNLDWKIKFGIIFIPALVYGLLIIGLKFPQTERVAAGVTSRQMYMTAFHPGFILIFLCMFATASTELGPNQWMESVLKQTAKMSGTLVLAYISGLMFVMRFFAGTLAHKINPVGMLMLSSVFSTLGLLGLSFATNPPIAYLAATVFAVGVCYYWPTMLGYVGEQFPKGGAFTMSLMGTAGMVAIVKILPIIGGWRDHFTKLGGGDESYGAAMSFRYVAVVPMFLIVIFGLLNAWYHVRGGYKAIHIGTGVTIEEGPAVAQA